MGEETEVRRTPKLLVTAALVSLLCATPYPAGARIFDFTVYLDDREIGRQSFAVADDGGERTVQIEAEFNVKLLFFTAYRYRHTNREIWMDGCLQGIASATSDGGDEFFVSGEKRGGSLSVTNRDGTETHEGCVKSFAYWDPSLLTGSRLLNSQTGKMDTVVIEELGSRTIDVRGVPTKTDCRRIVSDEFTIVLWYAGDEWVALESTTAGGKRLSYALR